MKIYQKRIKKRKFKQSVELFLVWIFVFIGCISVLNWSIGIFAQAGEFWLVEPRKVIIYSIPEQRSVIGEVAQAASNDAIPGGPDQIINEEVKDQTSDASSASQTGVFTAYNADPAQTDSDPFTMASGKRVYEGAVANNCLPFGTEIKVNGKIKIVEDRMNSRYDCDHFDIYMESYDEAIKFGKRELSYSIKN